DQPQIARAIAQRPVIVIRVMVPLPLRAQPPLRKIIRRLRSNHRTRAPVIRHRRRRYRLSRDGAVRSFPDHRPTMVPSNRLQMHNAPMGPARLEVNKPAFPIRRLHVAALMWTVDGCRSFREHHAVFVWTPDAVRPQYSLRSGAHTPERRKDVVVVSPFVELWAFEYRQVFRILHDHFAIIENMLAIGGHAMQDQRPRPDFGVDQIRLSIVVPERARVLEPFLRNHRLWRAPRPAIVSRCADEDPLLRRRAVDVETAVVS